MNFLSNMLSFYKKILLILNELNLKNYKKIY